MKENEKSDKYLDFARELKTLIVIGMHGKILKGLVRGL